MGKKILIVTGSPRSDGNTNTLATAFAAGAAAAGAEIKIFDAQSANIGACHADGKCLKSGSCGLPDDGKKMDELLTWADTLVIASPVYFSGFTAPVKAFIDRLYPYTAQPGRARCSVKDFYLLSACAMGSADMFDGVEKTVGTMCAVLKLNYAGKVLATGVAEASEIKNHREKLAEAITLGCMAAQA